MGVLKSVVEVKVEARWAMVALRLVMGAGFLMHGLAKWQRGPEKFSKLLAQVGVPFPLANAWLVTGVEICGGALLLLGLLVTIASVPLIISMIVAMLTVQIHYGFSAVNTIGLTAAGPVFGPPGYEINLLYIAGLAALALSGPTAFSLDRFFLRSAGGG